MVKKGPGGLEEKHIAVAAYAVPMTRDIKVSDEIFVEVKKWFDENEIVEITATVAAYNCVSRFSIPLAVGEEKRSCRIKGQRWRDRRGLGRMKVLNTPLEKE